MGKFLRYAGYLKRWLQEPAAFIKLYCRSRRHRAEARKTVLIMIHSLYGGGAEKVACVIASGLAGKYDIVMACSVDKGRRYPLPDDISIIFLPSFIGKPDRRMRMKARYVKHLKKVIRVSCTLSFMYGMNALNVASSAGDRVICSERNNPLKREPDNLPQIRKNYAMADHVVFQSSLVRDLFGPEITSHCSILPNPVSIECVRSKHTRHRIINVGRLNGQKNQAMLIRAFRKVYTQFPEYTLSIYGEGELYSELMGLIRDLGLEQAVELCGNVEHVHREIADAEFFVLSSDYEGLSNALLECMMMGMPCISTACEGSVDVIRDGVNGILVPVGGEEALTKAMIRLIEEPAFRESLGREAAVTAEDIKSESVIRQWEALIEGDAGDA